MRSAGDFSDGEIEQIRRDYMAGNSTLRSLGAKWDTTKGVLEVLIRKYGWPRRGQGMLRARRNASIIGGGGEEDPASRVRCCQFPLWDQDLPPLSEIDDHFCGAPVDPGSSYCADHRALCRRDPKDTEGEE